MPDPSVSPTSPASPTGSAADAGAGSASADQPAGPGRSSTAAAEGEDTLDRAEGRTELAGDLAVRQLAQIAQHERLDQRRMRLLQVLAINQLIQK